MRGKLVKSDESELEGYGEGYSGDTERYEYECLCGKGRVVEEHDNIPGFRDHTVFLNCSECEQKYEFNLSKGVRGWELVEKALTK